MFPSSSPIHYFLPLNWKDLLQSQGSVFSFSLFSSILFNLNLISPSPDHFGFNLAAKALPDHFPLAYKIRLGTVAASSCRDV